MKMMKTGNTVKTTRLICLAGVLVAATCAVPGCHSIEEKNRQADKTADLVLKLLAAEQTDSLYDHYTTEGFRRANTAETMRKLGKALKLYLGEPEKHVLKGYRLKTANGSASGEYEYKVQWTKAAGTLKLKLHWQNGAWKIQTLDILSPALEGGRKKPADNGKTIHI